MLNDFDSNQLTLSISISTVFLISVLVLGVLSYPSPLPNLNQDFGTFDFQHQLGNMAFADEDDDEEENGEENDEEHNEENEDGYDEEEVEIDAEVEDGVATVEVEIGDEEFEFKFILTATDPDDIREEIKNEILARTDLTMDQLVFFEIEFEDEFEEEELEEAEDEEELEGVIISVNPDGSFTIETEDGTFTIFTDGDTEFDDFGSLGDLIPGFGVEVEVVLSNSSLVATEIEIEDEEFEEAEEEEEEEFEEEIEIEVEVEHGVAKVKVEFDDQKTTFVEDFVDEDSIAESILNEVPDLPLSTSEIMDVWDLDIEEYEEDEEMSYTTMIENEEEAVQTALDLIYELQQKIEQLENRIQTLLEKYESGEYFGTVPQVDPVTNSYIISFDGSAISIDDESVVDAEGEIFIENLLTFGGSVSKFRVTGGEISIDNTFYDIVFGKARVSSSGPSGEKDSVVLLGQVVDFADEDDDSATIKLVIDSETPLEGDFGLEPISIEILPQSKIAGQWHLSGSGELSFLRGLVSIS